jgi:hypothetical protein
MSAIPPALPPALPHTLPEHPALQPLTPWKRPLSAAFQGQWPETTIWSGFSADAGVVNAQGLPIRFVPPSDPPPAALEFEQRIFETGEVETRHTTWHDTFHACAWLRYPRTKARINALHMEDGHAATPNGRSRLRNRLTLFDEGGIVVVSANAALLAHLRARAWKAAFWQLRQAAQHETDWLVFGHALYERVLDLHYGSTGRAWLLSAPADYFSWTLDERLAWVDRALALALGDMPRASDALEALFAIPVNGIPGWNDANAQETYYDDAQQFRPPNVGTAERAV